MFVYISGSTLGL